MIAQILFYGFGDIMKKILKVVWATVAYWLLVLFGPILVFLWNFLSPGSYKEDDFGFTILRAVAQAIACGIAYAAAEHISHDEHDICILVNVVICAVIFVVLFLFSRETLNYISNALSFITCVVLAVSKSKEISNKVKNVEG